MNIYSSIFIADNIPKHDFNTVPLPKRYNLIDENFDREEIFKRICNGYYYRDINEHAPTFRRFAEKCQTTAEFGLGVGCSARAILTGIPSSFIMVELRDHINSQHLIKNLGVICKRYNIKFTSYVSDDIAVKIGNVDLLHLDSNHQESHVLKQLQQNSDNVNKYILGHDYKNSGVVNAFATFLKEAPNWEIIEIHNYNNGLVVLEKVDLK